MTKVKYLKLKLLNLVQTSNMSSVSGCPMTTMRKERRYLATVAKGEAISLQGDKSDVKLEIKEGCPKRAYLMEVRTDPSRFGSIIPDDECFISPIVEVLTPAETSTSSYTLRIPHCLDKDDDRSKVKVRMIHENRKPVEVPKGNAGELYYNIDENFIQLHTTHFTKVICTICQKPYYCLDTVTSYWYAKLETEYIYTTFTQRIFNLMKSLFQNTDNTVQHDVEIRPYFGGVLHAIVDFRKVILSFKQSSFPIFPNFQPNAGRILPAMTSNGCDPSYVNAGRILPRIGRELQNIGKLDWVFFYSETLCQTIN